MRVRTVSYSPAVASTTGFASAVSGTSGVAFVLAATTPADGLAHLVTIAPSKSVSGNYTITGTDAEGTAQTETLATATTSTVTSVKYFATVTSVLAPSGITDATVNIGWSSVAYSPVYPVDSSSPYAANVLVTVTGTINFSIQETYSSPFTNTPSTSAWNSITALASKTANTAGQCSVGSAGFHILINSMSAGATIKYDTTQPTRP